MRAHRKRLQLSQRELAFLLVLRTRSAVAQHEMLARIPNAKLLLKYEALFGRPMGELLPAVKKEALDELMAQASRLRDLWAAEDDHAFGRKIAALDALIARIKPPSL